MKKAALIESKFRENLGFVFCTIYFFQFQIDVEVDDKSPLFKTLDKKQQVLLTHGDSIDKVADNYKVVATSKSGIGK